MKSALARREVVRRVKPCNQFAQGGEKNGSLGVVSDRIDQKNCDLDGLGDRIDRSVAAVDRMRCDDAGRDRHCDCDRFAHTRLDAAGDTRCNANPVAQFAPQSHANLDANVDTRSNIYTNVDTDA